MTSFLLNPPAWVTLPVIAVALALTPAACDQHMPWRAVVPVQVTR